MHRQTVYPGQILPETTLLNMAKDSMIGAAKLSAAILGTSTMVNGLACGPTSPASMLVAVAAGEIYSLQNVDSTAFSSLAADTAHQILKQGLLMDAVTLPCPAPATAGQSINYLVQATYQDVDTGLTVLPYYNASNPAQAYSGPANSGTSQATVRQGLCQVAAKVGVAATSGAQVTPAPDPGYIGLYVVTVANGASTITGANISAYPSAPFLTENLTQKIGLTTGDARYATQVGFQQSAYSVANAGGTSDAITGTYSPAVTALTNGMLLNARAASANATTAPTFTPASGTIAAKAIVKGNGLPLVAGDIAGSGHWIELRYDLTLDKWVLLNPAKGVSGSSNKFNGVTSLTANTTLTATQANGAFLLGSPGSLTITLPLISACQAGDTFTFEGTSSASSTVQRQGSDNISMNGATSVASVSLGDGDTLVLVCSGSYWAAIGGSKQVGNSASFGASKASNGYQKLPSGLIIQWGMAVITSGSLSVSFPIAFPTSCASVVATTLDTYSVGTTSGVSSLSTTGFIAATNTATKNQFWIAIGF